jgi:probable F420-dependent oxidoreductase
MDYGEIGLWTFQLDQLPTAQLAEVVLEIEQLGYGAVWVPEAVGKDPLVHAALILARCEKLVVATGIASIYARDAMAMAAGQKTLTEAYPERFLLGLGVSHQPMVEGLRGHVYDKPVATMSAYLDAMANGLWFGPPVQTPLRTVIGALGPKMTRLAADKTWGVHPYNVPIEHIAEVRAELGAGPLIATELAVVAEADAAIAREAGRAHLAIYLGLPNYVNNLRRHGFTDADFADGGSDRLVDALVAWGTPDQIATRVSAFLDAGADHVCLQALGNNARAQWSILAPALFG